MQRFGFERDFGFAHDDVFGVSAIACIWFAEDFVAFLELRHAGNRLPISLVSLAIDDRQSKISNSEAAPLAQLAEQLTLNQRNLEAKRPMLPKTLRIVCGMLTRYQFT